MQTIENDIRQLKHDNRILSELNRDSEDNVARRRKYINSIHKKQQLRAELKCQPFIQGNAETKRILQQIEQYEETIQKHIHTIGDNITKIAKLENEIRTPPKKLNVDKKTSPLYVQMHQLTNKIEECNRMIKEEEMRHQYIEYGIQNSIINDQQTLDDLVESENIFKICNEHRQEQLLNDWRVCDTYDGCSANCGGWTVGNGRCDCGNYKGFKWNDDDANFSDILKFDITYSEPFGYVETMW